MRLLTKLGSGLLKALRVHQGVLHHVRLAELRGHGRLQRPTRCEPLIKRLGLPREEDQRVDARLGDGFGSALLEHDGRVVAVGLDEGIPTRGRASGADSMSGSGPRALTPPAPPSTTTAPRGNLVPPRRPCLTAYVAGA